MNLDVLDGSDNYPNLINGTSILLSASTFIFSQDQRSVSFLSLFLCASLFLSNRSLWLSMKSPTKRMSEWKAESRREGKTVGQPSFPLDGLAAENAPRRGKWLRRERERELQIEREREKNLCGSAILHFKDLARQVKWKANVLPCRANTSNVLAGASNEGGGQWQSLECTLL